jgi:hypothetical protein
MNISTNQPPSQIPNYGNYQPDQELIRLRRRVSDLVRLGAATPETYIQTVLQLFQEVERRRQACMSEADDYLRKHHALVAQAHGFSSMSSILFSIINGFATLEERRLQEMTDRAKERAENGPAPTQTAAPPAPAPAPAPVETAAAPTPAPAPPIETPKAVKSTNKPGGKRKKP